MRAHEVPRRRLSIVTPHSGVYSAGTTLLLRTAPAMLPPAQSEANVLQMHLAKFTLLLQVYRKCLWGTFLNLLLLSSFSALQAMFMYSVLQIIWLGCHGSYSNSTTYYLYICRSGAEFWFWDFDNTFQVGTIFFLFRHTRTQVVITKLTTIT